MLNHRCCRIVASLSLCLAPVAFAACAEPTDDTPEEAEAAKAAVSIGHAPPTVAQAAGTMLGTWQSLSGPNRNGNVTAKAFTDKLKSSTSTDAMWIAQIVAKNPQTLTKVVAGYDGEYQTDGANNLLITKEDMRRLYGRSTGRDFTTNGNYSEQGLAPGMLPILQPAKARSADVQFAVWANVFLNPSNTGVVMGRFKTFAEALGAPGNNGVKQTWGAPGALITVKEIAAIAPSSDVARSGTEIDQQQSDARAALDALDVAIARASGAMRTTLQAVKSAVVAIQTKGVDALAVYALDGLLSGVNMNDPNLGPFKKWVNALARMYSGAGLVEAFQNAGR